jgi:hypothetical protein
MVRKTKKSSIETIKIVESTETAAIISSAPVQISRDTMTAVLIISLVINLFILVGWVTLQTTTAYDAQVAAFLFTR